jgi:predicted nucleic acid-binding protein
MDCLVDTNVILRAADQAHSSSDEARRAMRKLFMQGNRLCLDKNGLGLSAELIFAQLVRAQKIFHILKETDEIYTFWRSLVLRHQVLGIGAYDTRLVAVMRVYRIDTILTYNVADFRRYEGVTILRPDQV